MKRHIPNMITSCNLICGCIATHFALRGVLDTALLFVVLGAAFDFCDGLSARLLGVSSEIGKELDSLADNITFGFAPAAAIFSVLRSSAVLSADVASVVPYMAFVLAAFSALRLAKFNLDTRQTTSFIGLPTPANALFWLGLLCGQRELFASAEWGWVVLLVMMFVSCWLLVSEVPMFALKFKHWGLNDDDNIIKYGFLVFSAVVLISSIVVNMFTTAIAIVILAYILTSLIIWCTKAHKQ